MLAEKVILKRFAVISISCEILLNVSLLSGNARFCMTMIFATRKCYFEAIRSDKVEIDITCEILLNVSISSWNARFKLSMRCATRKSYFWSDSQSKGRDQHFMWDFAEYVALELKRTFWNDYYMCYAKMIVWSDWQSWEFPVRSSWMCRFRAETRVLDWLWSLLPENFILKRLAVIRSRSTFHVRFCSMCRSRAETHVLD